MKRIAIILLVLLVRKTNSYLSRGVNMIPGRSFTLLHARRKPNFNRVEEDEETLRKEAEEAEEFYKIRKTEVISIPNAENVI